MIISQNIKNTEKKLTYKNVAETYNENKSTCCILKAILLSKPQKGRKPFESNKFSPYFLNKLLMGRVVIAISFPQAAFIKKLITIKKLILQFNLNQTI